MMPIVTMKRPYTSPRTTSYFIQGQQALLSASVTPDGAPTTWSEADDDNVGVEINVKESGSYEWDF